MSFSSGCADRAVWRSISIAIWSSGDEAETVGWTGYDAEVAWIWVLAAASLASATGCSRGGDWQRKDAYRLCAPAIDDYPAKPAPPCSAMLMCANEAVLTAAQQTKLTTMLKAGGCAAP